MSNEFRRPGVVDEDAVSLEEKSEASRVVGPQKNSQRIPGEVTGPSVIDDEGQEDRINFSDIDETAPKLSSNRAWKSSLVFVVLLILISIGWAGVKFVTESFSQSIYLGFVVSVLVVGFVVSTLIALWTEVRSWRSIDSLLSASNDLQISIDENNLVLAKDVINSRLDGIALYEKSAVDQFRHASSEIDSVADYIQSFENLVLEKIDERCAVLVRESSIAAGLGVAALPHPAMDSIFVLFKSMRLVRQLAELHGISPTKVSQLKLFVLSINSAFIAGITSAGLDAIAQQFATTTLETVGAKAAKVAGEGLVTVTRVYRMGKKAEALCRPIALSQ